MQRPADTTPEARQVTLWLGLAAGSLILSGLLSLSLVIGRLPPLGALVPDPGFFRRCLVIHVDLSLLVWMYSFCAALMFLLARAGQSARHTRYAGGVALAGILLMLLGAGAKGARPVLANYVPMIDHWSFGAGLVTFAAGVLLAFTDRRLLPARAAEGQLLELPPAATVGLRATGVALLLAALTFLGSWLVRPRGLPTDVLYELTAWGGGHTLQLASTSAMASVWIILIQAVTGRSPLSRAAASLLFGCLVLPWLVAPLLPLLLGIQDVAAREAYTLLMRWAIFPPVVFLIVRSLAVLGAAARERKLALADPRLLGVLASMLLTVLGYLLGAAIRGSTTMIPAHYHAAIGAVTVSFMAMTYVLLDALGMSCPSRGWRRIRALQPALFGGGQAVFALGFALAGLHGTGRKIYGAEQQVSGIAQWAGLAVMGLGGLFAVCGGLFYLAYVVVAWARRERKKVARWALAAPEPGGSHG